MLIVFVHIKVNYYWFNRQKLLEKPKDRYHKSNCKQKSAEYYIANRDVLKGTAKNNYKNFSEKEKEAKRENSRNRYKNMEQKIS